MRNSPSSETKIGAVGNFRSGQSRHGVPWDIHIGDARDVVQTLKNNHFRCVVTSPPYFWQRDYKVEGQIGLESEITDYVDAIVGVMDQVKQVLHKEGLLFLNLGDTYYSAKGQPKGNDKKNAARRFGLRAVDASGLGVPRKTILGIPCAHRSRNDSQRLDLASTHRLEKTWQLARTHRKRSSLAYP